ncbi:MAG: tRNA dihydrouridine(20/20a) synthase DusA [Pseudomonadales bacterium]|nr:tRNA dihydrouridine(20/20a) synthase DusA [Pseudomonadales bacterium]MBO6702178.1 tRNA dihydrouridine(20/20a) synthase DusA [Pseudomonadales bacterium]MBO7006723.1 tRNA dihydrouridine(20/20a) synthase DusA [Pseudomonadales bacterium]
MQRTLCVAPMMGCTDRHCRYLFRQLSANALLYSEMLTSGALLHGDAERLLEHTGDAPAVLQLGGSNPRELAEAAKLVEQFGYQEVNLNCGCPSDRVQQGGIGACLMGDPSLVAECYTAMSEAVNIPVTIKSRIGIDDQDDYPFFSDFVRHIYDAGCRHFQVHARKAVLSGLSPKENREIPPLKYDYVRQIQAEFPDTEFVLNGGIKTVEEVVQLLQHFPGVMLGRAPYHNPYLLAELESAIFKTKPVDRITALAAYRDYMIEQEAKGTHVKHMAKHLLGLFTGIPGARAFRRHLSTHMYRDDAKVSVVDDAVDLLQQPLSDVS